jgi:glutathione S-transferase
MTDLTNDGSRPRLHYYPGNASLAPHILLEELGVSYDLVVVDRAAGAQKQPAYLALNPAGRIPVLEDGALVVFETAAIVLHLCDTRDAEHRLAPPPGTPERARFYQWLTYLTNTPQADAHAFFYPEQHTTDPRTAPLVKASADARLSAAFTLLDVELSSRGPFLLGERFGAVDAYLAMLVRWGRFLLRPPIELPALGRLARTVAERPAFQRAMAQEGLLEPYFTVAR